MNSDVMPNLEKPQIDIDDCRILIVDDNNRNCQLIGAILSAAGMTNQAFAGNGVEGLEKVASFKPDIIILDIMMPQMDGLEFMHHMRANTELGTVPILVQTALSSSDERNNIYAAGATDMLTKPLSPSEMIIRVRTHLELRRLTQNYQDQIRMEAELNAARRMQEALLPPSALLEDIHERSALGISAHFETSSELGGDLWGVHILDDQKTGVFMIDFSGHGVSASLNTFRLHTIMSHQRPLDDDPARYLSSLNTQLRKLLPIGQFATMFYGIIDTANDSFVYSAAGAPFPLIGHAGSLDMAYHDASGVPLGMKDGVVYENRHLSFPPGSFLFLYSDALIETPNVNGIDMDDDGVKALLHKGLTNTHTEPVLNCLRDRFYEWIAASPTDDLTLVLAMRDEIA